MNDFFKELFAYGHRHNQQLAEMFVTQPDKTSEKARRLFSHILTAHRIWNHRIQPQEPVWGIWDMLPAPDFAATDKANLDHSLYILDHDDLDRVVPYLSSQGAPFSNTIRDILFQVINHSTYHRGQIATEFKLHGLEPLATDYILFKR